MVSASAPGVNGAVVDIHHVGKVDSPLHAQPAEQLRLDFEDIKFSCPSAKRGDPAREILRGVNGRFRPGKLTAILGPSGAGKTSLLSILSGNRTQGTRGRVSVNGRQRSLCTSRQQCVLVAQELSLLGALTARESLHIAAQLKLGRQYTAKDRDNVVRDIADILGLDECLDTSVKNLSGGERKRVSIGVELVTNPPIMFFDEPTSGLDSVASVQVVSHLLGLARSGHTVAVVLHQPSSRLFSLFDDLLVLAAGRSLYCGPVEQVAPTLANAGFNCPNFYNLADFVMEVASGERGQGGDSLDQLAFLSQRIGEDGLRERDLQPRETDPMLAAQKTTDAKAPVGRGCFISTDEMPVISDKNDCTIVKFKDKANFPGYAVSFWVQLAVLFKRSLLVTWRDLHMAWLRFAAHVVVGVLLGILYKDIGNEASKIAGNTACLFFFVLFLFFANAMPTVLTFPLEAAVFLREHGNHWYSLRAYYLSKVVADLPFQLVNPTAFLLVAIHMTDQPTDNHRPCMLWLICVLTVLVAHSYGLVMGAAFNMEMGVFLVPASTIPMVLFSGFFLQLSDIPKMLQWLSYVSNFRYSFEGIIACVYGMDRAQLACNQPYCHWKSPEKYLTDIGMIRADYWFDVTLLIAWFVGLQLLLIGTLKFRVCISRR